MVTIALRNKDTQPSQTCSEGYTFSATALYRGVSLFLGGIELELELKKLSEFQSRVELSRVKPRNTPVGLCVNVVVCPGLYFLGYCGSQPTVVTYCIWVRPKAPWMVDTIALFCLLEIVFLEDHPCLWRKEPPKALSQLRLNIFHAGVYHLDSTEETILFVFRLYLSACSGREAQVPVVVVHLSDHNPLWSLRWTTTLEQIITTIITILEHNQP